LTQNQNNAPASSSAFVVSGGDASAQSSMARTFSCSMRNRFRHGSWP
jgi:hypothetical protein